MAYVNNENIELATNYSGEKHSRCCCNGYVYSGCQSCKPEWSVCCLLGTRDSGKRVIFARRDQYTTTAFDTPQWLWIPGDPCDELGATNVCGTMYSRWHCSNTYKLEWLPTVDCDTIQFTLTYLAPPPYSGYTSGYISTTVTVSRDWYKSPLVMEDPGYTWNKLKYPEDFPDASANITFTNCPIPTEMDDCGTDDGTSEDPDEPVPPCDPGCWPPCVKCPVLRDLALAVTQADSCCLHGVFPLTYNSGANNYSLDAPVGGPVGTCGQIVAAIVSCIDSSHVSLYIQLKETGGSVGSPSTVTLTATCVDGEMETSSVHIYGLLFDLCGIGFPLGADIRVITI